MTNKRKKTSVTTFSTAKKRGFTLIEMLVAVLLLTMAIGGPLTISSKGFVVARVAKDQTTAFYLAQDAVEFVRYARDTNSLGGYDWLLGSGSNGVNLGACISTNGSAKCQFSSLSADDPAACSGGVCSVFYYNNTNKQFTYTQSGNTRTPFTRTVSIVNPYSGVATEAVLNVSVSWSDIGGVVHTITVTEDLFDWQ